MEPFNQSREVGSLNVKMMINCCANFHHFKCNILSFSITIKPKDEPLTPSSFLFQSPLYVHLVLTTVLTSMKIQLTI